MSLSFVRLSSLTPDAILQSSACFRSSQSIFLVRDGVVRIRAVCSCVLISFHRLKIHHPPGYSGMELDSLQNPRLGAIDNHSDSTANPYENCSGVIVAWGVIEVSQLEITASAVGAVRLA